MAHPQSGYDTPELPQPPHHRKSTTPWDLPQQHPEKGLLAARTSLGGRTITVVQYWRSFDQLEAFAKNPNDPHLPAWRAFNRRVGASGDVGIYHETYRVGVGRHESIYANMPVMGLAEAGRSVQVGKRSETARARIQAR